MTVVEWIKFCYYTYSVHADVNAFKKVRFLYNLYLASKLYTDTIIMQVIRKTQNYIRKEGNNENISY